MVPLGNMRKPITAFLIVSIWIAQTIFSGSSQGDGENRFDPKSAVRLGESRVTDIALLEGQRCEITSLAFSPDGRLLASADIWGTITLWGR